MKANLSCVLASSFDGVSRDLNRLLLQTVAKFVELFSNVNIGDGTKQFAFLASFRCHFKVNLAQRFRCAGGRFNSLCFFVCALFEVLCENFLSRHSCQSGYFLWNKVVAAVAILYGNDIVLVAKVLNILLEYNFHLSTYLRLSAT